MWVGYHRRVTTVHDAVSGGPKELPSGVVASKKGAAPEGFVSHSPPDGGTPSSPRGISSSEPSSLYSRMIEAFGGADAEQSPRRGRSAALRQSSGGAAFKTPLPSTAGTTLAGRYVLRAPIAAGPTALFVADDLATRRTVTVALFDQAADGEALVRSVGLARSVKHPNVCRIHDVVDAPPGIALILDGAGERTMAGLIAELAHRGPSLDEIRKVGSGIAAGLAAIHAAGLVHGAIRPENVLMRRGTPALLGFQLAVAGAQRHPAEDVGAFARTMVEMWSSGPAPADVEVRDRPLRARRLHPAVAELAVDELRSVYAAASPDPEQRPAARHIRFFESSTHTPSVIQKQPDQLRPGPTIRGSGSGFVPGAMSLLVTYSATAPELVGRMFRLERAKLTIGRTHRADLEIPDQTISGQHATMTWENGAWLVHDLGSTNGTFADPGFERVASTRLRLGGEIQLGELRALLVSFAEGSRDHQRALHWLSRRDGLTGLLEQVELERALQEDCGFADWADLPLHVVTYHLRPADGGRRERLTILEMRALRRAALLITDLTDSLLVNLHTVVAGRCVARGPWRQDVVIAVVMLGVTRAQAQLAVDTVLAELGPTIRSTFSVRARLGQADRRISVRELLGLN
jgi:pSer/pThr/pTyr-binding forkhead associated (FHA) protein/serine/threonine protein kinase